MTKTSRLFSYETLVHAVSGAAGGVTAMSVFYPLDTIRSRLQVEDNRIAKSTLSLMMELIEEEGIYTLYRGIGPVLSSLCCSNFVYFYTFHGLRAVFTSDSRNHAAVKDLGIAAIAGVINVILTTPLWVANNRIKMQGITLSENDKACLNRHPAYKGIFDALVKMYQREGWKTLWSSLVPSLVLVVNPTIQFTVYEFLKFELLKFFGQNKLNVAAYFLLGAISKSISTIATYPLQLVQTKLRYGSEHLKNMSIIQILINILRVQGLKGLYKGLEAKLLQTVCTAALMFLFYEKISAFVFKVMNLSAKAE